MSIKWIIDADGDLLDLEAVKQIYVSGEDADKKCSVIAQEYATETDSEGDEDYIRHTLFRGTKLDCDMVLAKLKRKLGAFDMLRGDTHG